MLCDNLSYSVVGHLVFWQKLEFPQTKGYCLKRP